MSDNRIIKSRKTDVTHTKLHREHKDLAKTSIIEKVKSDDEFNSQGSYGSEKMPNNKNDNKKKKRRRFFKQFSIISRISMVIIFAGVLFLGYLFVASMFNRGNIVYGERQEPVKIITENQVKSVESALKQKINADKITVNYLGYRLVVVMDLEDSVGADKAKDINKKAFDVVNTVLPIKDYFSSSDKLNNDLYLYSADIVPTNYEQTSKYIIETYKNSKMSKPSTYNLFNKRDKKSYQEVVDSMKKAEEDAKKNKANQ